MNILVNCLHRYGGINISMIQIDVLAYWVNHTYPVIALKSLTYYHNGRKIQTRNLELPDQTKRLTHHVLHSFLSHGKTAK